MAAAGVGGGSSAPVHPATLVGHGSDGRTTRPQERQLPG